MNVLLIARRDIAATLRGYSGHVIIAACLFFLGALFQVFALEQEAYSHEVLSQFFYLCGGVINVAAILLTMRSLAEERLAGTDVLLTTSTASTTEVVLGKYLGAMAVLGLLVAFTIYLPALIFVNGKVSVGHIVVGYLGVLAMGSATASIGIASSSLFRSQIPAAIVTTVILGTLIISWMLSDVVSAPFSDVFAYAAFWDKHFSSFQEGRLHMRSLIYYLSVSFVFLLAATKVLEGRRWR